MKQFSIDYSVLDSQVVNKTFKLSEVKDRLEKVAFDVVRFKDGDPEELWQIQNGDDGDYIVAKYEADPKDELAKAASSASWDVLINKTSGDINIFYKGYPVVKLDASQVGVKQEDLETVKRLLPGKLGSSKELVNALLKNLNTTAKTALLKQYPELS